ncbi:hypothetical protein F443_10294, partial [Phytophthora nicotianae P1569]
MSHQTVVHLVVVGIFEVGDKRSGSSDFSALS